MARSIPRGHVYKREQRLTLMQRALLLVGDKVAIESAIGKQYKLAYLRLTHKIAVDTGLLRSIMIRSKHERKKITVARGKVTFAIDHPGAKYRRTTVLPKINHAQVVSRGIAVYRKKHGIFGWGRKPKRGNR